jgi:hypothetical protein
MPGGSEEHIFCLDMAHMDLGPLSHADSITESILASSSVHMAAASGAAAAAAADAAGADAAAGGRSATASPSDGELGADEGTHHSTHSCSSALDRVAQSGDRSYHYSTSGGGEAMPVASSAAASSRYRRALSLRKSEGGLLVGSYVLQPWEPGSKGGRSGGGGTLLGKGASSRYARSVHGGVAFFNKAADCSVNGRLGAAQPAYIASKTVHGGTEHAARQGRDHNGGIFYQG